MALIKHESPELPDDYTRSNNIALGIGVIFMQMQFKKALKDFLSTPNLTKITA